jgi:hypothetical protein
MARARFSEILRLLATNEVDFIVVGMTAGVLQGVPVTTIDLDIVHRRDPANVARRLGVLADLDAVYLRPAQAPAPGIHLLGPGHQLLTTTHGDLDCLGAIGEGVAYEQLLERTVEMALSGGLTIRVLSLPALIEAKEQAGRPKDLAVLPVLRATLDEMKQRP